jgi:hypothetical protein
MSMDQHQKAAIASAAIPVVIGAAGLLKLKSGYWLVIIAMIIGAALSYKWTLTRSRGTPPRRF